MTLLELAAEYRFSAAQIQQRMAQIRLEIRESRDPVQQLLLRQRLKELQPLHKETRETARYLETYYIIRRRRNTGGAKT